MALLAMTLPFCACRLPEEPRPLAAEVLLAGDQNADVHPLHRGVLLRQRQGRQPGLLRRLCGQSERGGR